VQRKVFRIETMLVSRRQPGAGVAARDPLPGQAKPSARDDAETLLALQAELAFVHEAATRNKRELMALIGDDKAPRLARAGEELSAAVDTMRGATNTILSLAEAADDSARTLAASLKDEYMRGLTQDIQDQIVKVYETCNFQDIAGQHIGKVIRMLTTMEEQLDVILARCSDVYAATQPFIAPATSGDNLLNGPKISSDAGHATQHDIDRMFA
jgi:chemotaxis protein CheZ